jgi:hypothetical protein
MRAHCLGEDSLKESQQIVEKLADAIIKHKIKDTNQNKQTRNILTFNTFMKTALPTPDTPAPQPNLDENKIQ